MMFAWDGMAPRLVLAALLGLLLGPAHPAGAQLVPGTGTKLDKVGDDFEDAEWSWVSNAPKSSDEQDHQVRLPGGFSRNGRWAESALRGAPDIAKRVPTPPGGIAGSQGALLMRTLQSGVPGRISNTPQQDDFLANVSTRLGGSVAVARSPSVVVRVYIPPFDEFEQRTGNSFGFRTAMTAPVSGGSGSMWRSSVTEMKPYWPGIFIRFNRPDAKNKDPWCSFVLRAGQIGNDLYAGPKVTEAGWWTLGMSFTPDGMVHYYIRQGVDDLRAEDRVGSYTPYGYRAVSMQTMFFDVCNLDDGRSWSTPWVVDDPAVYVLK